MIEKVLKAKHWVIFLLMTLPTLIVWILMFSAMTSTMPQPGQIPDPRKIWSFFSIMSVFPLAIVFQMTILFCWKYGIIFNLRQYLPEGVEFNYSRIKAFLIIPFAYLIGFCLLIFLSFSNPFAIIFYVPALMPIIILMHFFSIFCLFHTIYFAAKTIKTVEMKREVTFSDMAGEFFLMCFFLIGIWILQPRINMLANGDLSYEDPYAKKQPNRPASKNDDLEVF